ncbi:MAG: cytidylyltransferase domain-containing protein [Magnetovibrionaceae bacterium]
MSKTIAIVQARMGSSRLPGKVMKTLAGRTVLDHVADRCLAIPGISAVWFAVPEGRADDPLADWAAARDDLRLFRGSEQDVLSRYHGAALAAGAGPGDYILRATADCPLLDPMVCSGVIETARQARALYTSNNNPPSWPHGLDCECIPFEALDQANAKATERFDREHVLPFVRRRAAAESANFPCPEGDLSRHRWTLDEPADFAFLSALFDRIGPRPESFSYTLALAICLQDPSLQELNAGITTPSYQVATRGPGASGV